MATAYESLGNFSAAVQAYSHAFQIDPNWLTAGNINREYGEALVGNGEEQKAVSVFSDLLENLTNARMDCVPWLCSTFTTAGIRRLKYDFRRL
jgi:Tfp pilus assembly protein PilF